MTNTPRKQTLAGVVIGVALFTGRPGTASELPVSFLRRIQQADVSSRRVSRAWPIDSHVRSAETRIVTLLRDGVSRSSSLRALVAALDTADVIVYIESNLQMPRGFSGYLVDHVNVAGDYRYLQVVVNPELSQDRLIEVIAHELQHAVEVAETSARSDVELRALFKRLDSGTCGVAPHTCTETDAAVRVQAAVSDELRSRPARPRDH